MNVIRLITSKNSDSEPDSDQTARVVCVFVGRTSEGTFSHATAHKLEEHCAQKTENEFTYKMSLEKKEKRKKHVQPGKSDTQSSAVGNVIELVGKQRWIHQGQYFCSNLVLYWRICLKLI